MSVTVSTTSNWNISKNGYFNVAANWSNGAPNSGSANAVLGTKTAAYVVTSNAGVTLSTLEVDKGATLDVDKGATPDAGSSTFSLASTVNGYSELYNYGAIVVGANATMAFGTPGGSAEIAGAGSISVAGQIVVNAPFMEIYGASGSKGTLTLTGGTIVGAAGQGADSAPSVTFENESDLINGYGTIGGAGLFVSNAFGAEIDASASGKTLVLATGSSANRNAGLLKSEVGSTLEIEGQLLQGGALTANGEVLLDAANVYGGGSLSVGTTGKLVLQGGGQLTVGGLTTIAAGGVVETSSGDNGVVSTTGVFGSADVLSALVDDNLGTIAVVAGSTLNLNATIVNGATGTVALQGAMGHTADLVIYGGGATIDGGAVTLSAAGDSSILSNGAGTQFSNNATISGAGVIGDGYLRLYNGVDGVVDANAAAGLTLKADVDGVTAGTVSANYNAGLIETTGAGVLTIEGALNSGGTILDAGSGNLTLNDATIASGGGVIKATGTGAIVVDGGSVSGQDYLSIGAKAGLDLSAGASVGENINYAGAILISGSADVEGHWTGATGGSLTVGSSASAASVDIWAGNTWQLIGPASVTLANAGDVIASAGAGTTLQLRNATLKGAGTVGDSNMTVNIASGSTIDATGAMTIDSEAEANGSSYTDNFGVLEATAGGALTLDQAVYSPGLILASGSHSTVSADNAVYGAGLVEIGAGGVAAFDAELDSDVDFLSGGGTLGLVSPSSFNGKILGFAANSVDVIDLHDVTGLTENFGASGFGKLDGTLSLSNGVTLDFEGNMTGATFSITSKGNDTLITRTA